MNGLAQDLRSALRQMRKAPGFTLVALVTLGLGIGGTTAIFSNVNALVLRPYALPRLNRVVAVWETIPKLNAFSVKASPADFRDWTEQSRSFEHLAAVHGWNANLTGDGLAERVEGYRVTTDFFSVVGVPPQLGRNIGSADFEHGAAPVVMISYGFWQTKLGGVVSILGRSLLVDGQKFTVIGVAGRDLDFPAGAQLWAPIDLTRAASDRADHYLFVLGRLKEGVSTKAATSDLQNIAARLGRMFPNTNGGHGARVVTLVEDATTSTRQFVLVLMGAAAFVLMLAAMNVANLQLARVSGRQKEMAVRMGLGASRWQLIRQLLVEGIVLSGLAAVLGSLLSIWGLAPLRRSIPPFILTHVPGLAHVEVDARVLAFTIAVALVTGLLTGIAPALRLSQSELNDELKENSRVVSSNRAAANLRKLLVLSEVALALVLLVGAGMMVKGFRNLLKVQMGFDPTRILTFHVSLPQEKYRTNEQVRDYCDRMLTELKSLPGVESAAAITSLPSGWTWNGTQYVVEGKAPASPGETSVAVLQIATPDFLKALHIPLLEGRFISDDDGTNSPSVVVISETMARDNWPAQNPIGRHLKLGPPGSPEPNRTVVGVVGDIKPSAFDHGPAPAIYVPFAQLPRNESAFVVRTATDPAAAASFIVAQMREIDRDVPAYDVRTLQQVISDNTSGVDSGARMMMIFGVIALALAAAGIFAVVAYSVSQRTHEIGIRMAMGAKPGEVVHLVMASSLKITAIGLAIGLAISVALGHVIASQLNGVVQMDAGVFVLFTFLLGTAAVTAAYVPAHRASKIDPMRVLHYE